MRSANKCARPARRKRAPARKAASMRGAKEFLRHTFYYLKSEQFLKVSRRLLCEAVT